MRTIAIFLISFFLTTSVSYQVLKNKKVGNEEPAVLKAEVLENPSNSPTPIPTPTSTPPLNPTSTPSPTPTPTLLPTSTPTFIPVPTTPLPPPATSEQINAFIERFAAQYGVDANVLRHIGACESGLNPLAVNGPYVGIYQFSSSAWINNRKLLGEDTNPDLRYNAEESVQTAAYVLSVGKGYLWPNCIL